MHRKHRLRLLSSAAALAATGACLWFWLQLRQDHLNRALIAAIKGRQAGRAIALLDQGADANATDTHQPAVTIPQMLADFVATMRGRRPTPEPPEGPSALLLACIDPGYRRAIANYDMVGKNIEFAHPRLLCRLLDRGANPNVHDSATELTPLEAQVMAGSKEAVVALLGRGANPNLYVSTPALTRAVVNDHPEIAQMLIAHGADLNALDSTRRAAINEAAAMGDEGIRVLDVLLRNHADVNGRDYEDDTPLICAVECGYGTKLKAVKYLLQHGADPTIGDCQYGKTPLVHAKALADGPEKKALMQVLSRAETTRGARP